MISSTSLVLIQELGLFSRLGAKLFAQPVPRCILQRAESDNGGTSGYSSLGSYARNYNKKCFQYSFPISVNHEGLCT